jgi:hypothetical protein
MARFCSLLNVFRAFSCWAGSRGGSTGGVDDTGGSDRGGAEKLPDGGVGLVSWLGHVVVSIGSCWWPMTAELLVVGGFAAGGRGSGDGAGWIIWWCWSCGGGGMQSNESNDSVGRPWGMYAKPPYSFIGLWL